MSDESILWLVAIPCFSVFGLLFLWGMSATLSSQWRRAKASEQDAVLKRDMIERGFSADEIVRVLQASSAEPQPVAHSHRRHACVR